MVRLILEWEKRKCQRTITDSPLLRKLMMFLADNIGKLDNKEVDFVATKTDEKKYIQVTESMNAPETRVRELSPLRKIPDNYEKIVIAMECDLPQDQNGIRIIGAVDFLLSERASDR